MPIFWSLARREYIVAWNHFIFGSNTEALMLGTPCPTVTIGPHVHGGFGLELGFRRIICISDLTSASVIAGNTAQILGRSLGSEIDFYHVPPHSVVRAPKQLPRLVETYCNTLKILDPQEKNISSQLARSRISSRPDLFRRTGSCSIQRHDSPDCSRR